MTMENLMPVQEFCRIYQIEVIFLNHLYESGLVELVVFNEQSFIPHEQVPQAEKYIRLHIDLDLNIEGLEVVSHLLPRIESLQREVQELQNLVRFYENYGYNYKPVEG